MKNNKYELIISNLRAESMSLIAAYMHQVAILQADLELAEAAHEEAAEAYIEKCTEYGRLMDKVSELEQQLISAKKVGDYE